MYFWLFAFFLKVTLRNSILSWKLWWLHRKGKEGMFVGGWGCYLDFRQKLVWVSFW